VSATEERDYLIVSDLHLRGGWDNPTSGLYHFDEEFAEFLRHYRLQRGSTRPWTLVIGGDFIEFLYITDMPAAGEPLLRGVALTDDERRYGLGSEAAKARWKLDVILRSSHPQLLIALARFIAEGNEIVVLRGNHDVEMFWPEVQEHFARLIAEHHPAEVSYLDMKRMLASRLRFVEWFFYVPGRLYVEHGCQYDPFCSFEYFFDPVVPERPAEIEAAISELAIRYFTNQMKLVNAMAAENIKSVSQYVVWLFRANFSSLPAIFGLYGGMIRRVLAGSGPHDVAAERAVRGVHEDRMRSFEREAGLPEGTANEIDRLHVRPIMRDRLATIRFLALDLWAAGFALVAAAVGVLAFASAKLGALAMLGAFGAVGLLIYAGSIRLAGVTQAHELEKVAARVASITGVANVVFGHSHRAGAWPLDAGVMYLNVGTWVPVGEKAFFVYALLTGEERSARLARWNKETARPEPFEAGAAGQQPQGHARAA
jgi:UDP-2,3-diacylglucosamine pyrophosphatase LpxH